MFIKALARAPLKPFSRRVPADALRISIASIQREHAERFAAEFQGAAAVEVHHGDLLSLNCDAIVSPANSFGDMGGGIDAAIDRFYGGRAQPAVDARLADQFLGEIPVGCATLLDMGTKRFRYLVCAPTMRVPGLLGDSINAYLAMRAALITTVQYRNTPLIRSIAVPTLCTGVGGMPAEESARQMLCAYQSVLEERWREVQHPAMAPYAMRR